jgi:hypothetical protein
LVNGAVHNFYTIINAEYQYLVRAPIRVTLFYNLVVDIFCEFAFCGHPYDSIAKIKNSFLFQECFCYNLSGFDPNIFFDFGFIVGLFALRILEASFKAGRLFIRLSQ